MLAATGPAAPAADAALAFAAGKAAPAPGVAARPAAGDPVPSLVLRTGVADDETSRVAPALEAAGVLDRADLSARLTSAAAKKASELGLSGRVP
jgi:hypothetical protein